MQFTESKFSIFDQITMNNIAFMIQYVHSVLFMMIGLTNRDVVIVFLSDSHGNNNEVVLKAGERDMFEGELLLVEDKHFVESAQH